MDTHFFIIEYFIEKAIWGTFTPVNIKSSRIEVKFLNLLEANIERTSESKQVVAFLSMLKDILFPF